MYRLLIADDEQIERLVLVKTLAKHMSGTCEIYQAQNGRQVLAMHQEKQIQIAVLDIEMPGINGIEAAEKIRETDPDCSIIFLTAYDEFNYAKKAITVQAVDYLLKPCQENELLAAIDEAILRLEYRREKRQRAKSQKEPGAYAPADGTALDSGQVRMVKVAESIGEYICRHYREDISLQQVAQVMNYSDAYFSKLFKQCFDQNFTAYLTEYRISKAKQLLLEPMINVKDVGEAVGYPDSNYFAKVFRRYTGYSPTEYRIMIFREQSVQ